MRLSYIVLVAAAATLLASGNAATASVPATGDAVLEQTKTTKEVMSPGATQWERSLTTEEIAAPVKASLRGAKMADGDEERGITVPAAAKTFGAKLKRLALYHRWIFGKVKPEDVLASKYYASYLKFYDNRMIRGGKYA
ncbi:hypothetical protein KRP22_008596 [Phytophthora ramorum]|uniref:uncharacterized protein n=1 Tax=Phytophthora ramorum TaxID=164328 RepID=UPI003099FBCD|nr:hypothetical protein KRP23_2706 [Phytophthora ramorum]KAH7501954.1 hypothetical protein KRP22_7428 [Phytophthora ramorum]